MTKKVGDFLALGMVLLAGSLWPMFYNQSGLIKICGLTGVGIVVFVESYFIYQKWAK